MFCNSIVLGQISGSSFCEAKLWVFILHRWLGMPLYCPTLIAKALWFVYTGWLVGWLVFIIICLYS